MKYIAILPRLVLSLSLSACATAKGSDADGGPPADATSDPDGVDADLSDADINTCPGDPCQILPQCGCDEQACDLDGAKLAEGGTACRDVVTAGTEASSCSVPNQCAEGFVCLGTQCRAYCNEENACSSGLCIVEPVYDSGGGVYLPIPGVTACSKSCAPEKSTDNGCPTTPQHGCHLVSDDPDGVPDSGDEYFYSDCRSAPATGGGDGADCAGLGDPGCKAGFECVGIGATTVCKQLCIVPGGACETGTCDSLVEVVVIDGIEYGVCL